MSNVIKTPRWGESSDVRSVVQKSEKEEKLLILHKPVFNMYERGSQQYVLLSD